MDFNGREGMVSIRLLVTTITVRFWRHGKIKLRVKVDSVEGRVAYRRSLFEGGTELIPPY